MNTTRPISWIKAALKDFGKFPSAVKLEALRSLTIAAEGRKAQTTQSPFTKTGIKTPQHEIDLIRERLKRLREMLR
jgi:phage-related protein